MDMLRVAGLRKRFGGKSVLNGLDLAVPEHSVFGFIGKNGAGKTTTMKLTLGLLTADAGRLNLMGADCAIAAQKRIRDLGEQGVSVALGTVSGVSAFTGLGPKLSFRFTPVGTVRAAFHSEFYSAGINQTLHRITLELNATVRVVLPGKSSTVTVTAQAPVAESVIVGDVPDAYTNVADREQLLNFVPKDPTP